MANGDIHIEKMGFREWTTHYEKEQETQRAGIDDLTRNVSSLSADVRTLIENQRGLYSSINKPVPYAAYVAGLALIVSFGALLVTPIKESIDHIEGGMVMSENRGREIHLMMTDKIVDNAIQMSKQQEGDRWSEKMADRNNAQIDRLWFEMKYHHSDAPVPVND